MLAGQIAFEGLGLPFILPRSSGKRSGCLSLSLTERFSAVEPLPTEDAILAVSKDGYWTIEVGGVERLEGEVGCRVQGGDVVR